MHTPWGRLPYGVSSALEEFQLRIHEIGVYCIADDILVVGQSNTREAANEEHDQNVLALMIRSGFDLILICLTAHRHKWAISVPKWYILYNVVQVKTSGLEQLQNKQTSRFHKIWPTKTSIYTIDINVKPNTNNVFVCQDYIIQTML